MACSLLYSLARNLLPSKVIEKADLTISFVGKFLSCSRPFLDVENNLSAGITGNETDDKKPNVVISAPRSKSSSAKKTVDAKKLADLKLSQVWSWLDEEVLPTSRRSSEKKNSGNIKKIQKNIPERNTGNVVPKNYSEFAKLLKLEDRNISLKFIFQQHDLHVINEIIVPYEVAKYILKVSVKLRELILETQGNYYEIPYTARAVITLLKFLFDDSYYIPNMDVALETYALSKAYHVDSLRKECRSFFKQERDKYFSATEIKKIYKYVEHYHIREIRNLLPRRSWAKTFKSTSFEFHLNQECYVAWTSIPSSVAWTSIYPSEIKDIDIPLWPVEKTMDDTFEVDITNNVVIRPVLRECVIWGAQIKLNTDLQGKDVPLKIIYQVKKGGYTFEEEIEKSLRPSILIEFKKKVIVDVEEVEVSFILEDIRATLCSRSLDTRYKLETNNESISAFVTLSSSRKSASNNPLIFIQKIFYSFTTGFEFLQTDIHYPDSEHWQK